MNDAPKGFVEDAFDIETGEIVKEKVNYLIVERDGRKYAEPVDRPRNSLGVRDDGVLCLGDWWPLEHKDCPFCRVYGLVRTVHVGEYACANCGNKINLPIRAAMYVVEGGRRCGR